MNFNHPSQPPGHTTRLPPFIQYYVMLRKGLKGLSNGLSSISLALLRRLFYLLSDFLRYLWFRKRPWSTPHYFPPAGIHPSTQPDVLPGVAASNSPCILTPPTNVSASGVNIEVGGSLAPITGPSLTSIGTSPSLKSQLHTEVSLVNPRIFVPFVATSVQRYEMDTQIVASPGIASIQPLIRQYPERQLPISTGWEAHVHPEGALYFYHPQKRIFTDTDLQEEDFLTDLNTCTEYLLELAEKKGVDLASNIELIVELGETATGEQVCSYYFADRVERTLFWLHELNTEDLFDGVRAVKERSHIRYAIQFQYWVHCDLYPNNRESESSNGLLKELREIVVHASADIITSDTSLSPFAGEELSKILGLIDHLQKTTSDGCGPYSMCVIARFMQYFARAKFFNFCGQPCARLEADQSIYTENNAHVVWSTMSAVVELFCFGAPRAHMTELQRVWVDKSTSSPRWKDFNEKLGKEWISITIYSTVMLTVDVSFLLVPSSNVQTSYTTTVILAYLSTFCVVGSLVVSIILAGRNRKYGSVSASSAVVYLTNMTKSMFGDKALATIHSLPFVLLMWGMIYFIAAFASLVFRSTPTVLLGVSGCGFIIIFLLTLWPVWSRRYHVFTWLRRQLPSFGN